MVEGLKDREKRDMAAVNAAVAACFESEDFKEGQKAFLEKRRRPSKGARRSSGSRAENRFTLFLDPLPDNTAKLSCRTPSLWASDRDTEHQTRGEPRHGRQGPPFQPDAGRLRRALPADGGAGPAAGGSTADLRFRRRRHPAGDGGDDLPGYPLAGHWRRSIPRQSDGSHPHAPGPFSAVAAGEHRGDGSGDLAVVHAARQGWAGVPVRLAAGRLRRLFDVGAGADLLGQRAVAGLRSARPHLRLLDHRQCAGDRPGAADPGDHRPKGAVGWPKGFEAWGGSSSSCCP